MCFLLFLLWLRFHGTGQVKECQGFMKHFKPEALGKQMRDALEMKYVSLPLPSSESWEVLCHTDEPSIFHSFPIPLFARLGSYPYIKKNGGFQSTAGWWKFWHEWIYTTYSKKVKAFFLFTQVNKQKTGLKYIRVQFHETRIFALFLLCFWHLKLAHSGYEWSMF